MALLGESPAGPGTYVTNKIAGYLGTPTEKQILKILGGQADRQQIRDWGGGDQARQLEIRQQQGEFAALLKAQAEGRGPSLFAPALAAAQRAGTAVAASGRGANTALAGRTAAQTTARLGMGATELKMKEQMLAQQQYGALLAAQRAADLQARGLGNQIALGALQSDTAIALNNASGAQNALGSVLKAVPVLSDPSKKTDVAPVGSYTQPYGQPAYGQPAGVPSGYQMQPGLVLNAPPVPSGVDMKTNIEPIGGVNPRFSALTAAGTTGFGAAYVDAGPRPRPLTEAEQRLAAWQAEQQAAMAASNPNQVTDPTQIDLQLAQARTGPIVGQSQQQQPQQPGPTWGNVLQNFGAGLTSRPPSDPIAKTDEQPVGQLSALAAQVQPYKFRYIPQVAAQEGLTTEPRVGAMASKAPGSLASNPVYAPTVQTGPDGMDRVDGGQATMANIAVTADIARKQQLDSRRLDALEAMALQGASGKGARGKRVVAEDVVAPPAGATPTGQRYKALADLSPSPLTQASYGRDLAGPSEPSPGMPRMQVGVQDALDNIGRNRLAKTLLPPRTQAELARGDANLDVIDDLIINKRALAQKKSAAESNAPDDVKAYVDELQRQAPYVFPGSSEEAAYQRDLKAARGQLNEGQLGGTAFLLQQNPTAAKTKGFETAGQKELARRRSAWIRRFAGYAQENAEQEAAALGENAVRLRPEDVAALLKQRGAPVTADEVRRALKRTKSNKPIITL